MRIARFLKCCILTFALLIKFSTVSAQNLFTIESIPLVETRAWSGAFVTHELDHTTTVPGGDAVQMFEANGSGVAVNDLNNDGLLDIVLGNHAGQNTILWNEGNLSFR